MQQYIVGLMDQLAPSQRQALVDIGVEIIYESKFLPVIGIETNQLKSVQELDFVSYIEVPEEGYFQEGEFLAVNVQFQPPVRKGPLVNNQLLGWGDTRIAILDSGVNDQSELNLVECRDFTNTGTYDQVLHGTHVTKIIKHFARGANLYFAKVGHEKPNKLLVMMALEWAVEKNANIINMSIGFKKTKCKEQKCELCALVREISKLGILVIVAAGNNEMKADSIDCPGIVPDVVTIGAIDKDYNIAKYSSIGAPGEGKPNLVASGNVWINGVYREGTSFAAPLVSGVLGAILSRVGNASKALEYIYKTVTDLGLPSHHQGVGCINLDRLVEAIVNEIPNFESAGQEQGS